MEDNTHEGDKTTKKSYLIERPEVIEKLFNAIADGYSYDACCAIAGIAISTFHSWKKKGKDDIANKEKTIYSEFLQTLKEKEAAAESLLVDRIKNHSTDDWRAGAWILERRFPNRYSATQKHEVKQKKEVELTDEELDDRIKKLQKRINGETD